MKARKFRPCTVSVTAGLLEPPLRAEATLDPNICPSLFLSYPGLGSSVGLEPQHSLPGAITSNDRDVETPVLGSRGDRVCCHLAYMVSPRGIGKWHRAR